MFQLLVRVVLLLSLLCMTGLPAAYADKPDSLQDNKETSTESQADYLQTMKPENRSMQKGIWLSFILLFVLAGFWIFQLRLKGGFGNLLKSVNQLEGGRISVKERKPVSRSLTAYLIEADGKLFFVMENSSTLSVSPMDETKTTKEP